jgi:hypothetical protein
MVGAYVPHQPIRGVNIMAAKKKKKAAKKKAVKKTAKRKVAKKSAPVKKAKKSATKKSVKKSAKKAVKKTSAKKSAKKTVRASAKPVAKRTVAKKKAVKKKTQIVGEGDYAASRRFDTDQASFVEKNKAEIPALAKAAEAALDGPEGDALREAEASAAGRSRDTF